MKYLAAMGLMALSFYTSANTYVQGVPTTITSVDSYNYGSVEGHIRILVSDTVTGCEAGYFVQDSNTGIDRALSIALSAFHGGAKVVIGGRSGVNWSGSSNPNYCQVHAITLVK
ncbi:hypothetical protein AAOGI_40290 [Agarivorans albus]